MVDVTEIMIWGELAGAVRWDERQQTATFQYHPDFLRKGWDLSPLKMPIREGSRIYRFSELRDKRTMHSTPLKDYPVYWQTLCPTDMAMNSSTLGWHSRDAMPVA
jgi:serine/threonine-protein kinase HipA